MNFFRKDQSAFIALTALDTLQMQIACRYNRLPRQAKINKAYCHGENQC